MRISVADRNLHTVLTRFRAVPGSRVELVLSPDGLDVVANAEGYRTLAKWCLVMAHPEMAQAHPRWLYTLHHLGDALSRDGEVSVVAREGVGSRSLDAHDVRFFRSETSKDGQGTIAD
jgi:hypothetical protein